MVGAVEFPITNNREKRQLKVEKIVVDEVGRGVEREIVVCSNEKTVNGEVVIVNDGMDKTINEKTVDANERTMNCEVDVTESNKGAAIEECKVERT